MPTRSLPLLLVLGAVLLLPHGVASQTVTGSMLGSVTDTSGAALPGVVAAIQNVETGATREVTTNEAGLYNAPFMPIGRDTGQNNPTASSGSAINALLRPRTVQIALRYSC